MDRGGDYKRVKEQYTMYNHFLIGKALFMSKLEEAAAVCADVEVHRVSSVGIR